MKIDILWESGNKWQARLYLVQLMVIQAINEKAHVLKQRTDSLAAYYIARDQANLVQALQEIWILHDILNSEI